MEKELLELRNYCVEEKEKAQTQQEYFGKGKFERLSFICCGQSLAFSSVIEILDMLLKMNIVKPLDERSPSDEQNQAGVSRPNDEAKSE